MCLSNVTERIAQPSSLIQDGWKKFQGSGTNLSFEAMPMKAGSGVPLDRWLEAEGPKIMAGDDSEYLASFHVYEDEEEAKKASTPHRRVYVRGVHTHGTQDGKRIMIARQLYVPSDPEAWPPLEAGPGPAGVPPSSPPLSAKPKGKEQSALERLKKRIPGKPGRA